MTAEEQVAARREWREMLEDACRLLPFDNREPLMVRYRALLAKRLTGTPVPRKRP